MSTQNLNNQEPEPNMGYSELQPVHWPSSSGMDAAAHGSQMERATTNLMINQFKKLSNDKRAEDR